MNEPLTQPDIDSLNSELISLHKQVQAWRDHYAASNLKVERLKEKIQDLLDAWDTFSETDDILVMDEAVRKAANNG